VHQSFVPIDNRAVSSDPSFGPSLSHFFSSVILFQWHFRSFPSVERTTTMAMVTPTTESTRNNLLLKILEKRKINLFKDRLLESIMEKNDEKLKRTLKNLEEHSSVAECVKKSATFCAAAATKGRMGVLKLLRKRGFIWDEQTVTNAFTNRHARLLKFAMSEGAPVDIEAVGKAAFLNEDVSLFELFFEHLRLISEI